MTKKLCLALAVLLGLAGSSQAQDPAFQKRLQQEIIQLLKDMDNRIQKLEDKTVFRHHQPYSPPSYSPPSYAAPSYYVPPDQGPPMIAEERWLLVILALDQWLGKMDRKLASQEPGYTPRPSLTGARVTGSTATVQKETGTIAFSRQTGGVAQAKKSSLDLGETKPGDLYRLETTPTPPPVAPLYTADKAPQKKNPLHLGD